MYYNFCKNCGKFVSTCEHITVTTASSGTSQEEILNGIKRIQEQNSNAEYQQSLVRHWIKEYKNMESQFNFAQKNAEVFKKSLKNIEVRELSDLIGHTILDIKLSADKVNLMITHYNPKAEVINISGFKAVGDCCSQSYIEHLELFEGYQKTVIKNVKETTLEEKWMDEEEMEMTKKYRTEIITAKGVITLEYRNESNGYYGGAIEMDVKAALEFFK